MNKRLLIGLGGLFLILGTFILYLSWPLMTGTDIVLHTRPVDPFDMFKGQYIALRYDISTLPKTDNNTAQGDTVYVILKQNDTDKTIFEYDSLSRTRPNSGVFIKGTVDRTNFYDDTMNVEYGIEQYYFERGATFNTTNMTVHAKVASNGQARIIELFHDGKKIEMKYRN